jgi:peptidoglycan lytic transglycosylase
LSIRQESAAVVINCKKRIKTNLRRYMIILGCFVFLSVPISTTETQIPPPQHNQLRTAMDRGDYPAAEQILRRMMSVSGDAFARNNYDYLLARLLQWREAPTEANSLFKNVFARNSPLSGYALWHQAEIERAAGRLAEEQKLLQKFISQFSDHLLRERAVERLSESYFKTASYRAAIDTLRLLSGPQRDAMAMIGEAQLALGQPGPARISFDAVLSNGSMDDASLRAVRGLDRLNGNTGQTGQTGQTGPVLTEAERLRRARIYQFNRQFSEARNHWLILASDFPRSANRTEILFQLGRGFFLDNQYTEAIKWYRQVYQEFPQTDEGEEGFYYLGHCYQYLNDADRAIARYEEFLKVYPKSDYVGYAHLNAIDTLRSAGRPADALKWAARAQTDLKAPFFGVTALFKQANIRLAQGNFSAALADFTALRSKNLNARGLTASTSAHEVAFMRGYCLEKLGQFDAAINEYLSLAELRNGATGASGSAGYYGQRATERLRALAADARARKLVNERRDRFLAEARRAQANDNAAAAKNAANQALRFEIDAAARSEMLKILRAAYEKLRGYQLQSLTKTNAGRTLPLDAGSAPANGTSHQTIAGELLFLGLYDEGAAEFAQTQPPLQSIALYCARGNCAHKTIDYSEPILNSLPADYRLELLPRDWAELFYPYPYRHTLASQAQQRGVDPRFVLSIVRQESRYDPGVKSYAAARGMMQFISSTADQIAAQLKLNDFEQNDLYDPQVAILFGSQYLKNLLSEFGSPQPAAAAYNGSEDSVRRWRARAGSPDVDRFVIEVLKKQTKDYVFKVMDYYAAYQKLYPNEPVAEKQ